MAVKIKCTCCQRELPPNQFIPSKDPLFPNGYSTICNDCLQKIIKDNDGSFEIVDRICQWLGVPFIPDKWIEVTQGFGDSAIEVYLKMNRERKFEYVDWQDAFKYYKDLEANGLLKDNIVPLSQGELRQLRDKWGADYDDDELKYLEHLYQDIVNSYSIFGGPQLDQIKKICKVSLIIENKIRGEEDYSKDIKSYQDLCKLANLEIKNIKDATDFSSVGEIFAYLEKDKRWINRFHNGEEKDIVDKTMHDMQNWSRVFYINESSIPSEIESRLAALQLAEDMEDELNRIEVSDEDIDFNEEFEATAGVDNG